MAFSSVHMQQMAAHDWKRVLAACTWEVGRIYCLTFKKCPLIIPKLKKCPIWKLMSFFWILHIYFKHRTLCCYCVCKSWLSEIVWARLVHNCLHPFSSFCTRWTSQEEWHTTDQQQLLLLPLLQRKKKKNYEITFNNNKYLLFKRKHLNSSIHLNIAIKF